MPDSVVDTKVLVVDDDEAVRRLILNVIQRLGYSSYGAENAARALQILDQQDIDLMLLDLHMPRPADGEDLLFLLRDRGDEVPIIIVSGWVDDEATINQPDCVHAVLKKPVKIEALAETVRQVLALA